MAWLIVVIVLVVLIVIGFAMWLRSRRRGGVIATPPSDPGRAADERNEP